MLKPLNEWVCDVCGGVVDSVANGYVIWKRDENMRDYGFKIVHKIKCDDKSFSCSQELAEFTGEAGLNTLLSLLSDGAIKNNLYGQPTGVGVKSVDEFTDLFRRVQVPYYEEARTKFNDADVLNDFSDANEKYPYKPEVLKRIISGNYD